MEMRNSSIWEEKEGEWEKILVEVQRVDYVVFLEEEG